MAKSPGTEHEGKFYPRDSIVIVDELATHRRDNLSVGLGWTVPTLSEEIKTMCERWGVKAQGVADDACSRAPATAAVPSPTSSPAVG